MVSHLKIISALIGEPVTCADANAKLEIFRSKISALQAKETAKRDEAQLHQKQITGLLTKLGQLDYALTPPQTPNQFEKGGTES